MSKIKAITYQQAEREYDAILRAEEQVAYPRVPHDIKHAAINTWQMPFSLTDYWFDRYYILHWQGSYLIDQVNQGVIKHDGVSYRINWITVPTLCYKSDQVMLSFRRIFGQAEGYVLIKVKGD